MPIGLCRVLLVMIVLVMVVLLLLRVLKDKGLRVLAAASVM